MSLTDTRIKALRRSEAVGRYTDSSGLVLDLSLNDAFPKPPFQTILGRELEPERVQLPMISGLGNQGGDGMVTLVNEKNGHIGFGTGRQQPACQCGLGGIDNYPAKVFQRHRHWITFDAFNL